MKKIQKRLLSWLMVMAMVLSVVHISAPMVVQAAGTSSISIGTPEKKGTEGEASIFRFNDSLVINGDDICSVSIQFVSPAQEGVEGVELIGTLNTKFTKSAKGNDIHLIINSADGNPLPADEWKQLLINNVKVKIKGTNTRKVMVAISDKSDFGYYNLIEYNADNGHYYELVPGDTAITWGAAREAALKKQSMGTNYEGYLINVTSIMENRFLYSICRTTSWIGTTCDPQVQLKGTVDEYNNVSYGNTIYQEYGSSDDGTNPYGAVTENKGYWFYVDGPEAGKLMTFGEVQDQSAGADNTMKLAQANITYDVGKTGKTAIGAYEDSVDNWANVTTWGKSILHEDGLGATWGNEPNNQTNEYCMVIYARDDYGTGAGKINFIIPSMWNDFAYNSEHVKSYVIEYSLKDGIDPEDVIDDKQSIITLNGTGEVFTPTVDGHDFMIAKHVAEAASDETVKLYSGAVATSDGSTETLTKEVTAVELNRLHSVASGLTADFDIINYYDQDKVKKVTATVYDNVTNITDSEGNITSQIGSYDFSVPGGEGASELNIQDVINSGSVSVITNGVEESGTNNYDYSKYTVNQDNLNDLNKAIRDNTATTVNVNVSYTNGNGELLNTTIKVTVVPKESTSLSSATLKPFKDDHGEDILIGPEHYYAGETIAVEKITLNNGVELTSSEDLAPGNKVTYKWQISDGKKYVGDVVDPTGAQKWTTIEGATGVSLSEEQTKAIAGNKVRVIITPTAESGYLTSKLLSVDGDGSSTVSSSTDKGAGGTFVDILTVNASDFFVKRDEVKTITEDKVKELADAKVELYNKNDTSKPIAIPEGATVTIKSDVASTLNKAGSNDSVVPVHYTGLMNITEETESVSIDAYNYSQKDVPVNAELGKTVNAFIVDGFTTIEKDDGNEISIGANNITVSTETAKTFVKANENAEQAAILADRAGVIVIDNGKAIDTPTVTIEYVGTPLAAAKGEYDVKYVYTYASGKTVTDIKKVIVEDPYFEVTPVNPDSTDPTNPNDGIDGPIKDDTQSVGDDYVYRIHLASDVDSVELNPEIVHASISGFTVDDVNTTIGSDGVYKVTGVTPDKDVVVKYTVKSTLDEKVYTYKYIIDREKGAGIDTTADSDPVTPIIDDSKDPEKVGDDLVKKITITVPYEKDNVKVNTTPTSGSIDKTYGTDGLNIKTKPEGVMFTNKLNESTPSFSVDKLSTTTDTIVSVKSVSDDGRTSIIYEYTIVREKNDDATIKGVTPGIGSTDTVKVIEITTDKTEYTWPIKMNDPNAKVEEIKKDSGNGSLTNPSDKSSFTISNLKPDETTVVKVTTKAENGDTLTYMVKITNINKLPNDGVKIDTTADPIPETLEDKPTVDDSNDTVKVGDELVKKIVITVPSMQDKVKVNVKPTEGKLDLTYDGDGLKEISKPDTATVNNQLSDTDPSFTVNNLSSDKDTVVSVKGISDDGVTEVIYEYTIKREQSDNINVVTDTTDSTPDDPTDDPKIGEPVGPTTDTIDGVEEQVKDIKITVPYKNTTLEVKPTPEDPSATFVTTYGDSGIRAEEGTSIDATKSAVTNKNAVFTVTDLKTDQYSIVSVKVQSADGLKTCVYRYSIVREKNNDATIKNVTPSPESTDTDKIVEITTDKTEYTWPIELNDPKGKVDKIEQVSGTGTLTDPEDKSSFTVNNLKPGETTVVKVTTKAENGDTLTYTVKVTNNSPSPVAPPAKTGTDGTSEPVKPEDITYEKTNPQDKTEPIDPSKQVPTTGALTINGVPVDSYTISPDGKSLIISKEFLNTLPKGSYPAVLTYADGTKQEFNVNVVDFDETTLVKNPPLFSMYKEIVLKKKNTFTVNLKGISDYAIVTSEITGKGKKAKKVVTIKQQKNGDVLITPKKVGKSQVTCKIVQNGAEYKVVVDLKVLKQYKGTSKNYNLKPKGLVKTSGKLPEFNVYKRIVKGKNTKIKFTKVATDAKVKFYVANKKEAKSLKIGKIKRKGKTATCTIKGKKKGWVHLTAEITQNGKTYYTRLLVRIDDGTWSKKQIKKYLK